VTHVALGVFFESENQQTIENQQLRAHFPQKHKLPETTKVQKIGRPKCEYNILKSKNVLEIN